MLIASHAGNAAGPASRNTIMTLSRTEHSRSGFVEQCLPCRKLPFSTRRLNGTSSSEAEHAEHATSRL